MKFKEAFELMKNAKVKIKLPSWGGYWCWENGTIMMHCKDGTVMDIRDTDKPEYTFGNICSDEWIIADNSNTPILGGIARFDFKTAVGYVKRGLTVTRMAWLREKQPVFLDDADHITVSADDIAATDWVFAELSSL